VSNIDSAGWSPAFVARNVHQAKSCKFGVLDALATKLASFVVAEGLVIPGADILAQRDGLFEFFPSAALQTLICL